MNFKQIIPVLESANIKRDVEWYVGKLGFDFKFGDEMYAGIQRENTEIHLQWHAGTEEDPVNGGAVIKIFVENIHSAFDEMLERGVTTTDKLNLNTGWGTHEFGFYDLNGNAIFIVQDV